MRRIIALWLCALGLLASSGEAQVPVGTGALAPATFERQVWYIGRQLRHPIVLNLAGVSEAQCEDATVGFAPSGSGLASPDAAPGQWEGGQCVVRVSWTLSDEVGRQHLTATLANSGSQPVIVEALGRQGARVFFGAGYTPREEAHTVVGSAPDGTPTVEQVDNKAVFRPVMGVDFAPWPAWERVRLAVGTGARDFDRQFYFGFSLLQTLVFGQPSEGSTVDVHAGVQLTRRDIAVTGAQCGGASVCTDSDLRFSGLALFIAIDGASAFRGLASTILR